MQHEIIEKDSYMFSSRWKEFSVNQNELNVIARTGVSRCKHSGTDRSLNHIRNCKFYGRNHERFSCPAYRQKCINCGVIGHFKICCKNFKPRVRNDNQSEFNTVQSVTTNKVDNQENEVQCGLGLDDFWINYVDNLENANKKESPALSFTFRSHQVI